MWTEERAKKEYDDLTMEIQTLWAVKNNYGLTVAAENALVEFTAMVKLLQKILGIEGKQ